MATWQTSRQTDHGKLVEFPVETGTAETITTALKRIFLGAKLVLAPALKIYTLDAISSPKTSKLRCQTSLQ